MTIAPTPVTHRIRDGVSTSPIRPDGIPKVKGEFSFSGDLEEEGMLVLEVQGQAKSIDAGLDYLARIGVHYEPLAQDVTWNEDRCIHCTACTSLCPTGALSVSRPDMLVSFDKEKCIACEACLKVCSYQALTISI